LLIREACGSHPRNYHAWVHWHFIVDIVHARLALHPDTSDFYFDILKQEFMALSHWVDLHISDHSAIYHLCTLGRLFGDLELRYPLRSKDGSPSTMDTTLVNHALSLIASYPTHESLWIYLRESVIFLSTKDREKSVEQIEASMSQNPLAKRFFKWTSAFATAWSEESPFQICCTSPEVTDIWSTFVWNSSSVIQQNIHRVVIFWSASCHLVLEATADSKKDPEKQWQARHKAVSQFTRNGAAWGRKYLHGLLKRYWLTSKHRASRGIQEGKVAN